MTAKKKILILEDDEQFVIPVRFHLKNEGFDVHLMGLMSNPEETQEFIFRYSPDVILCDINMEPNGFDTLKIIKSHSQLRLVPFIFITGLDSRPERIRAYLGGVDDFIIKPIDKDVLLAKIKSILKRQIELESAIYYDQLTEIYNRRYFQKELQRQLNLHHRHKDSFTLAILDIDHFKAVNDNYGHTCGDECLKAFSNFIKNQIRSTDIFSRWGGEEFVLIMERSEIEGAAKSLEKILNNLQKEILVSCNNDDLRITFSAGVAQFPDNGTDERSLMEAADKAVYIAKENGRCRVEKYQPK